MKRNAAEGTYNGETTYCPVNGWDCPYYKNGICHIDDPMEDCNDWAAFWESWEDWESVDDISDDIDESNYNPFTGCDEYEIDEYY